MISFSGTSYLGLDRHPQMLRWVEEGLRIWGMHYGGSRRSPLAPGIFAEVEAAFAEWTGAPAALLVSSGTQAGQLVMRYLQREGYQLYLAPDLHPALSGDGNAFEDWIAWSEALNHIGDGGKKAGLANTVDPLQIRQPNWGAIAGTEATLVLDDSHAIGLWGQDGSGSWRERQQSKGEVIISTSLGKALSLPAGLILGEVETIDTIRDTPQFGGASPPPPAYLHAWLKADALIRSQRERLFENIAFLQENLPPGKHFQTLPDFPAWGTPAHGLAPELQKSGIAISHFPYPGPDDPMVTRIVLRADHTYEQIDRLVEGVKAFFERPESEVRGPES